MTIGHAISAKENRHLLKEKTGYSRKSNNSNPTIWDMVSLAMLAMRNGYSEAVIP